MLKEVEQVVFDNLAEICALGRGEELMVFSVGDKVEKTAGDYRFCGVVVSAFQKRSGPWRYVVENDDGMLFVFNATQLKKVKD